MLYYQYTTQQIFFYFFTSNCFIFPLFFSGTNNGARLSQHGHLNAYKAVAIIRCIWWYTLVDAHWRAQQTEVLRTNRRDKRERAGYEPPGVVVQALDKVVFALGS